MKTVKKTLWLALILLLVCVCTFSACNSGNQPQSGTSSDTTIHTTETNAHVHAFGEWTTVKDATCTVQGEQERSCSCGEKETKSIAAIGHTEVVDAAVAATCTTEGKTEGKHCSVCNETLVAQNTIPASHTDGEWVIDTNPTCTMVGSKHQVCSVCSASIKTETIATIEHTGGEWIIDADATCTKNGSKHQVCSVCSATVQTATITAKGHTNGKWIIDTDATCTENGSKHQVCSVCSTTVKTETITAKGHNYGNWGQTLAPTCTVKGSERRDCGVCDHFETRDIDATGHAEVVDNAVAATCTETGLTEGKHCSVCSTVIVAQTIVSSLDHEYYEDNICTRCGAIIGPTEGIIYDVSVDGTYAIVVDYQGTSKKIIIAESYNGVPVTTIEHSAFKSKAITSVIIPDTVTIIGRHAFNSCNNLTTVVIGNNVKTIGYESFYGCTSLTTLTIPDSVTLIDVRAFSGCRSLTHVTLGEGLSQIETGGFKYCSNLEKINIPNSLMYIDSDVFDGCNKVIEKVDGVYYVGSCVVGGDDALSVSIREGSRIISGFAFYGSFNGLKMREIYIPSSVIHIDRYALATGGMASGTLQKIHFEGTIEQWKSIKKGSYWNDNAGDYLIYCTNGTIAKNGTVTYN